MQFKFQTLLNSNKITKRNVLLFIFSPQCKKGSTSFGKKTARFEISWKEARIKWKWLRGLKFQLSLSPSPLINPGHDAKRSAKFEGNTSVMWGLGTHFIYHGWKDCEISELLSGLQISVFSGMHFLSRSKNLCHTGNKAGTTVGRVLFSLRVRVSTFRVRVKWLCVSSIWRVTTTPPNTQPWYTPTHMADCCCAEWMHEGAIHTKPEFSFGPWTNMHFIWSIRDECQSRSGADEPEGHAEKRFLREQVLHRFTAKVCTSVRLSFRADFYCCGS